MKKETGKPRSLFIIYEYEGKCYGRILALYNEEGVIKETIEHPKERAAGVLGHPFYCGLDIVWNLKQDGSHYKGKIMDPEEGKIYNSEVWRSGQDLIVRGKLLFFGRNDVWKEVLTSELPKELKQLDIKSLTPKIPVPDTYRQRAQ